MKLQNIGLALGLAGLGVIASSMAAQAIDFNFSFSGDSGTNTGTVTGVIQGLQDNSSSTIPTDIIIYNNPVGVPTNTVLNQNNAPITGFFSVSGGQITNAQGIDYIDSADQYEVFFNYIAGFNQLLVTATSNYTNNSNGFSGVTYTPVQLQSVPESNPVAGGVVVPLLIGLRILNKRLARKSTASKATEKDS